MNKIFRVIWNQSTQTWMAVSELAKGHVKSSCSAVKTESVLTRPLFALSLFSVGLALAFPQSVFATTYIQTAGGRNNSGNWSWYDVAINPDSNDSNDKRKCGNRGDDFQENAYGSIVFGFSACIKGSDLIGGSARFSTVIGYQATAINSPDGVAVGSGSRVENSQEGVAFGRGKVISSENGVGLGSWATVRTSEGGVAVGRYANVSYNSNQSLAVAQNASVTYSKYAAAIGHVAKVDRSEGGISLGVKSFTNNSNNGIAIGNSANVTNSADATAFGANSNVLGSAYSVALGHTAKINNSGYAFSLGVQSNISNSENGVALGRVATLTNSSDGVAIGTQAHSWYSNNTVSIGKASYIEESDDAVAIGKGAVVSESKDSVALGGDANATKSNNAVAIGQLSKVENSENGIAIGQSTTLSNAKNSLALGYDIDISNAQNAVALGYKAKASKNNTVAVGSDAQATIANTTAVGKGAQASADGALALGTGALAGNPGAVAIGTGSKTEEVGQLTVAYNYLDKDGATVAAVNGGGAVIHSVFSVGASATGKNDPGIKRQIRNVAAGRITADSTDAINGSQLYNAVTNVGFNILQRGTGVSRVNNNNKVDFVNGCYTTAAVSESGGTTSVKFDTVVGSLNTDNGYGVTTHGLIQASDLSTYLKNVMNVTVTNVEGTITDPDKKNYYTLTSVDRRFNFVGKDGIDVSLGGTGKNIYIKLDAATKAKIAKIDTDGITFKGDTATTTTTTRKLGETLNIKGDGNIKSEVNANNGDTLNLTLNKNLDLTGGSVKFDAGGTVKMDGNGLNVGGVTVKKDGINANNKQITNLSSGDIADGNTSAVTGDAVFDYVKDQLSTVSGSWKLKVNDTAESEVNKTNNVFTLKQDKNIQVTRDGTNGVKISTADNVNFTTVGIGSGNNRVELSNDSGKLKLNNKQITGVESGLGSTAWNSATGDMLKNAVNVGDLKTVASNLKTSLETTIDTKVNAGKTIVTAGDNVAVDAPTGNSNTYTVHGNKAVVKAKDNTSDIVVNTADSDSGRTKTYSLSLSDALKQKIENANTTINTKGITFSADTGTATTKKLGDTLKVAGTTGEITTKIENGEIKVGLNSTWKSKVDNAISQSGTALQSWKAKVNGANDITVDKDSNNALDFINDNDDNLSIARVASENKIKFTINKEAKFNNITFGSGTGANEIKIGTAGISAGSKQITNLASGLGDGVTSDNALTKLETATVTNAVNVGDLKNVATNLTNVITNTVAAEKISVAAGDNVGVEKNGNVYTINGKKTVVAASSGLTVSAGAETANTTTYTLGLSTDITEKINKGDQAKTDLDDFKTKGITFTGNTGTTDAKTLGSTVAITGENYIKTTADSNGIKVGLTDEFKSKVDTAINNAGSALQSWKAQVGETEIEVNQTAATNKLSFEGIDNINVTADGRTIKVKTNENVSFNKITLGKGNNQTDLTVGDNGLDVGKAKITNISTALGDSFELTALDTMEDSAKLSSAVIVSDLKNLSSKLKTNITESLTSKGFGLQGETGGNATAALGANVSVVGADKNISTEVANNKLKIKLSNTLDLGESGSVKFGDSSAVLNATGLTIPTGTAGKNLTITKDGIDLGGKTITNLAAPTNDNDAANKKYVDEKVSSAASDIKGKGITFKAGSGSTTRKLDDTLEIEGDGIVTAIENPKQGETGNPKLKLSLNSENKAAIEKANSALQNWVAEVGDSKINVNQTTGNNNVSFAGSDNIDVSLTDRKITVKTKDDVSFNKITLGKADSGTTALTYSTANGLDIGGAKVSNITTALEGATKDNIAEKLKELNDKTPAVNYAATTKDLFHVSSNLSEKISNISKNLDGSTFGLTDEKGNNLSQSLGTNITVVGDGKNISTSVVDVTGTNGATSKALKIAFNNDLSIGKAGADGTNGTLSVNGKDGSSVVINGKDGSIGLTGPAGADGKSASTSIKFKADGSADVTESPATKYRLTYLNATGGVEEIASLNDGLKFGANTGTIHKAKLNTVINITGADSSTDWAKFDAGTNIMTKVDSATGRITIGLAKALSGLNSVEFEAATNPTASTKTKVDNNGITITPATGANKNPVSLTENGLDNGGNKITNVTSSLTVPADGKFLDVLKKAGEDPNNKTAVVNVEDLSNTVSNVTKTLTDKGFGLQAEDNNNVTASLGSNITVVGDGQNIATSIEDKKLKISFNNTLVVGKAGADGKDGSIGVTGKDGASVVLNGKDGSIGLTGPKGADGKSPTGNISLVFGKPDVTGEPDKKLRITYANGTEPAEEVATLNDGLKFAGNDDTTAGKIIKRKLNEQLQIVGEKADSSDTSAKNIYVDVNTTDANAPKLVVKFAENPEFKSLDLKAAADKDKISLTPTDDGLKFGKGATNARVKLTNLENATLSATSTDAVTGMQLHELKQSVTSGWKIAGSNDLSKKTDIGAGKLVNFLTSKNVDAQVDQNGTDGENGANVSFTVKVADLEHNTTTGAVTVKPTKNGATESDPKVVDENALVTAKNVSDMLAKAGWRLAAQEESANSTISYGEEVRFKAGNSLSVSRENNNITYVLDKNINVEKITIAKAGDANSNTSLTFGDKGVDLGGAKLTNVTSSLGDKPTLETVKNSTDTTAVVNVGDLKNVLNDLTGEKNGGFGVSADDKNKFKQALGTEIHVKGDGKNISTKIVDVAEDTVNNIKAHKALEIAFNDNLEIGKKTENGKDGVDGNITVNGKDGSNVTINGGDGGSVAVNGKDGTGVTINGDGSIGLKGKDGQDGISTNITLANGAPDVTGTPDKKLRLTYEVTKDGKVVKEEVATLNDGLKFGANTGDIHKAKLNSVINITGAADHASTDWSKFDAGKNIMTQVDNTGRITIGLAKALSGLNSVEFEDKTNPATSPKTKVDNNGITITPTGNKKPVSLTENGLDNGGNTITNVTSSLTVPAGKTFEDVLKEAGKDPANKTAVVNVEDLSKAVDSLATGKGFKLSNGTTEVSQDLGKAITLKGENGVHILSNATDKSLTIGFGKDLTIGAKDSKDADGKTVEGANGTLVINGKDGSNVTINGADGSSVAVNGKDGTGVVLNGKDGSIGLNGKDGLSTNIALAKGKPDVTGSPAEKLRLTYKIGDEVEQLATLNDGLKFGANTGEIHKAKLNSVINITGAVANTDWNKFDLGKNIMTQVDSTGRITIGLAKALSGLNSALFEAAENPNSKPTTKVDNNGITIIPAKPTDGTAAKANVTLTENGLDNGGNKITNVTSALKDVPIPEGKKFTDVLEEAVKDPANATAVANLGDLSKVAANVTKTLTDKGFGLQAEDNKNVTAGLGSNITVVGDGQNIKTSIEDNKLKISFNNTLDIGKVAKDGEAGKDGSITVNGKDGSNVTINGKDGGSVAVNGKDGAGVVLNGKDGSIGLTGPKGKDGAAGPTTSISLKANGQPDVTGTPAEKLRVTYKIGNEVEELATLNDGLKFAGNDGKTADKIIKRKLNQLLQIVGEKENNSETSGENVYVDVDSTTDANKLVVKIAKTLNNMTAVNLVDPAKAADAPSTKLDHNGITISKTEGGKTTTVTLTDKGLDNGGNKITNVTSALKDVPIPEGKKFTDVLEEAVKDPANKTAVANLGDLSNAIGSITQSGFALTDTAGTRVNQTLGNAIKIAGADGIKVLANETTKSLTVSLEGNAIVKRKDENTAASLSIQDKDGNNGTTLAHDGLVFHNIKDVNGKAGAAADAAKDGKLQMLNGTAGLDKNDSTDGKGKTRLVYTKPNGEAETVATLNDGLKFAANNGTTYSAKLNSEIKIGGVEANTNWDLSDKGTNIFSHIENGRITIGLAKALSGLNSVEFEAASDKDNKPKTKVDNNGITITPTGDKKPVSLTENGLDNGGNTITNVTSGLPKDTEITKVSGDALNNVVNVGDLKKQVENLTSKETGGFGLEDTDGNKARQALGADILIKGENGVKVTANGGDDKNAPSVTIGFSNDLTIGEKEVKDQNGAVTKEGKDGSITVNGKDGAAVSIKGEDGASIAVKDKDGNGVAINGKDGGTITIGEKGSEIVINGKENTITGLDKGAAVFTNPTVENKEIALANDGKWYEKSQVNANGTTVAGATAVENSKVQGALTDKNGNPTEAAKGGLADFANSDPSKVATVKDLQNLGFVVNTPDNQYSDQVRNGNTISIKGGKGILVEGSTNATTGARELEVSIKEGKVVPTGGYTDENGNKVVKVEDKYYLASDTVNGKPKEKATALDENKVRTDKDAEGFVTGKTVGDAIQNSGWTLGKVSADDTLAANNGTLVYGNADERVNPNDGVRFADGKNTVVSIATKEAVDASGKAITTSTVKVDVELPMLYTIGGEKVTKVGDKFYKMNNNGYPVGEPIESGDLVVNLANSNDPTATVGLSNVARATKDLNAPVDKDGKGLVQIGDRYYAAEDITTELNSNNLVVKQGAQAALVKVGNQYYKPTDVTTDAAGATTVNQGAQAVVSEKAAAAYNNLADLNGAKETNAMTVADSKKMGFVIETKDDKYAADVRHANRVEFSSGNDLAKVTGETTEDGVRKVVITVSKNPSFDEIKLNGKDGGKGASITTDGKDGAIKVSNSDGGPTRITNIAPGVNPSDAVNVSQLNNVKSSVVQLNDKVNKVDRNLRAGIAGALATGNLYQANLPGHSMVSAGAGTFKGESAIAVGYSRLSDNGKLGVKVSFNTNTQGETGAAASVGFQWK